MTRISWILKVGRFSLLLGQKAFKVPRRNPTIQNVCWIFGIVWYMGFVLVYISGSGRRTTWYFISF